MAVADAGHLGSEEKPEVTMGTKLEQALGRQDHCTCLDRFAWTKRSQRESFTR